MSPSGKAIKCDFLGRTLAHDPPWLRDGRIRAQDISFIAFSPDGSSASIQLWGEEHIATLQRFPNWVRSVACGSRLVSVCWDETVRLWEGVQPGPEGCAAAPDEYVTILRVRPPNHCWRNHLNVIMRQGAGGTTIGEDIFWAIALTVPNASSWPNLANHSKLNSIEISHMSSTSQCKFLMS